LIKDAIKELTKLRNSVFTLFQTPTIEQSATFDTQYWGKPAQNVKRQASVSQFQGQTKAAAANPAISRIPFRFPSLSECESGTKNCTGHGKCFRVLNSGGEERTELYSCKCKPTVVTTKDGKNSTYQWAGNACQKIDVSTPFWLLAGTSIFLFTVISLGIGMLYTMGNEELPSVIGAGVSGPKPK
jgi:hypothetical protein